MPSPTVPTPVDSIWSKGYARFLVSVGSTTMGLQIQNAAVGYHMYQLTGDPLALGMVGLAEALPFIGMAPLGGHVADRLDRRRVSIIVTAVMAVRPYTPWAEKVLRSAWMPAPAPESLPAIVSAVRMEASEFGRGVATAQERIRRQQRS